MFVFFRGVLGEYNLFLWVYVIMSLGIYGWGGGLVYVGGVVFGRVCRCVYKFAGGSRVEF